MIHFFKIAKSCRLASYFSGLFFFSKLHRLNDVIDNVLENKKMDLLSNLIFFFQNLYILIFFFDE